MADQRCALEQAGCEEVILDLQRDWPNPEVISNSICWTIACSYSFDNSEGFRERRQELFFLRNIIQAKETL